MTLRDRLRALLTVRGVTTTSVAEEAGYSQSAVAAMSGGTRRTMPHIVAAAQRHALKQIAQMAGLLAATLEGVDDDP